MANHPGSHRKKSVSRRVASAVAGGAVKAASIVRGVKAKVGAAKTAVTKPVGRARASQVERQISIDVERKPVSETFKAKRLAPEVEMARKRRGRKGK